MEQIKKNSILQFPEGIQQSYFNQNRYDCNLFSVSVQKHTLNRHIIQIIIKIVKIRINANLEFIYKYKILYEVHFDEMWTETVLGMPMKRSYESDWSHVDNYKT